MRPRSLALALVWLTALAVSLGDAEDKDASVKELSEHVSKGEEDINKALSVSQPGDDISDATMIQQDSCLSKMHALGLRVEKMQGVIQALEAKVGVAKVHGPAPAPVTSTPEKAPQLQRQVMSRGDHKENDRAWEAFKKKSSSVTGKQQLQLEQQMTGLVTRAKENDVRDVHFQKFMKETKGSSNKQLINKIIAHIRGTKTSGNLSSKSTSELVAGLKDHIKGSSNTQLIDGIRAHIRHLRGTKKLMPEDMSSKSTSELVASLKDHIRDADRLQVNIKKLPQNEQEQRMSDERKEQAQLYDVSQIFKRLKTKKPHDAKAEAEWSDFKMRYLNDEAGLQRLVKGEENGMPQHVKKARDAQFSKVFYGQPESLQMRDQRILEKKTATLEKRLSDLKRIEGDLHTRKEEMRKKMDEFMSDGPSVRLKLGLEKLKDKTSKDAWEAYRKRHQIAQLMKPRPANEEEKGLALQSLKEFSKSGSMNDLKVQVTKEVPNMMTMNKLQAQFKEQLETLDTEIQEKLKVTERHFHSQQEKAIHWQAKSEQCDAKLNAAKALNMQLAKRYHKHKSLEINAKWEFKQFHKRQEEGTVLHNRFVMQGLKSNWVRSKEEDTGRLIRPQPGAVSAELVALRGEQDASEIESPSNKKVNKMKVNNSSSTNSTGVGSNSTEHDMGEILPEIAPLTNHIELDLGQSISNSNSTNSNSTNSTDVDDDNDDADESDGGDDSLRPDDDDDSGVDMGASSPFVTKASAKPTAKETAHHSFQSTLHAELSSMQDLGESANEIYPENERFNDFVDAATKHLKLTDEQRKGLKELAKQYSN